MENRRTRVAGLALVAPLAACATYTEPGPDAPHAELILASTLGADPFRDPSHASHIDFHAWADATCKEAHGLLARFEVPDGSEQRLRIPVGKPMYVRAAWTRVVDRGYQTETHTCANLVSFLPEASEVYEISQTIRRTPGAMFDSGCVTIVRNMDDHRPVKSLREHPVEGTCK